MRFVLAVGREIAPDASGDAHGGVLDGIPGKVSEAGGCLHLHMTR